MLISSPLHRHARRRHLSMAEVFPTPLRHIAVCITGSGASSTIPFRRLKVSKSRRVDHSMLDVCGRRISVSQSPTSKRRKFALVTRWCPSYQSTGNAVRRAIKIIAQPRRSRLLGSDTNDNNSALTKSFLKIPSPGSKDRHSRFLRPQVAS